MTQIYVYKKRTKPLYKSRLNCLWLLNTSFFKIQIKGIVLFVFPINNAIGLVWITPLKIDTLTHVWNDGFEIIHVNHTHVTTNHRKLSKSLSRYEYSPNLQNNYRSNWSGFLPKHFFLVFVFHYTDIWILRIYFNYTAVHISVLQTKINMAQSIMMWHNCHQVNGATDISFQEFDKIYVCGHDLMESIFH